MLMMWRIALSCFTHPVINIMCGYDQGNGNNKEHYAVFRKKLFEYKKHGSDGE